MVTGLEGLVCGEDGNSIVWQYIQELVLQYCSTDIKAHPSRWISAREQQRGNSCVSGQEKQRKRRKRAGWTGWVSGSIRVLNRTSDFWRRVELVENVGLPAEPQSLSSDFKRRTSDHVVCEAVWRQALVDVIVRYQASTAIQTNMGVYACNIRLARNILVIHLHANEYLACQLWVIVVYEMNIYQMICGKS